ncbi:hypothetical protein M758_UG078300 [Ceratodon purpureus]|nr:hypothetical protein M758_UG078300 [Ceratodon purpureus]
MARAIALLLLLLVAFTLVSTLAGSSFNVIRADRKVKFYFGSNAIIGFSFAHCGSHSRLSMLITI